MPPLPAPKPGIYRGIDFDTYAQWDAVNNSLLHKFTRTPAHVRYELDHGSRETRAKDLGWLLHLSVLEPKRFAEEVVVAPHVDRRTKAGKDTWVRFQADCADKLIVDGDDLAKATAMRDALLAHETAGEFLRSEGATELSVAWEEKEIGVRCKARIDKVGTIGDWPGIVGDIKSARDASRRAFERSIYAYGYGTQAAHYLAGLEALVPVPVGNPFRRFVLFVVESEPPYPVACYEMSEETLQQAERERQAYLRLWRKCVETGHWPGYAPGVDLLSYPQWVLTSWSSEGGE